MVTKTSELSVDISFSARWWSFISSTRIFVSAFCGHWSGNPELSDRVSMTIHEMLENAVKYSLDPDQIVRCTLQVRETELVACVENIPAPEHFGTLQEEFAIIMDGDPLEVFINKMQDSVLSDKSQLGLARIRYEGDAELKLSTEDGKVLVTAIFALPPQEEVK